MTPATPPVRTRSSTGVITASGTLGILIPPSVLLIPYGAVAGVSVPRLYAGAFLPGLMLAPPVRVQGTAVFLTAQTGVVPHAMLHNLKHNKVLHERNVFLTVETLTVPYSHKRLKIDEIGEGFYRVVLRFGFMETPDVPMGLMRSCDNGGIYFDPMDTTYFASRETVVASARRGMPIWRDKLFALMHRNAAPATGFFRIPGNRLVELGSQVEI